MQALNLIQLLSTVVHQAAGKLPSFQVKTANTFPDAEGAVNFLQTRWQKTFAPSHHSLVGALIDPDLSRGFEIVGDPVFPVSQAILLGKNQCPYLVLGVKELRQDSLFQAIGNDRRNSRRRRLFRRADFRGDAAGAE